MQDVKYIRTIVGKVANSKVKKDRQHKKRFAFYTLTDCYSNIGDPRETSLGNVHNTRRHRWRINWGSMSEAVALLDLIGGKLFESKEKRTAIGTKRDKKPLYHV